MKPFVIPVVFAALLSAARADAVFQSGPARVALIELYTSEGCSSCPPAEKWLGELRGDTGLWRNFVPVAFHVNYWNHLGWRDVLASKAFTDREYAYADAWRAQSVYTPCFVRNGTEWHPDGNASQPRPAGEGGRLTVSRANEGAWRVTFTPPAGARSDHFDVSLALLGGGIVSKVKAGENSGRELQHEFTTLRLETVSLQRADDGTFLGTVSLAPRTDITTPRHALAAWVTPHGKLEPIQATGGWLE